MATLTVAQLFPQYLALNVFKECATCVGYPPRNVGLSDKIPWSIEHDLEAVTSYLPVTCQVTAIAHITLITLEMPYTEHHPVSSV